MVEVGEIRIKISADTSSFSREMTRAQQQASSAGAGIQSSLSKLDANGLSATSDGFAKLAGATRQSDEALKSYAADATQVQGGLKQLGAAQQQANSEMTAGAKATDQSTESLDKLAKTQPAVENTAKSIENTGEAAKKVDHEGSPALHSFAHAMLYAAESVAAFVAGELGLKAFAATLASQAPVFAAHGVTVSGWAERLADAYRIVRLAAAPTAFTAATIAAGIIIEKVAEETYREGGILERQSVTAGLNKNPISPGELGALSLAGRPKNESSYLGLYNAAKTVDLTSDTAKTVIGEQPGIAGAAQSRDLRNIAEALSAIHDPADRARAAMALFGDDGAKALSLLNARFAENADRVKDWGLVYSGDARKNIMQFREDIGSLGEPFAELRDQIRDSITGIKMDLVEFFAWAYAQTKGGGLTSVLYAPLAAAQIGALKSGGSLPGPDALGIQSGLRGARAVFGADVRGPGRPDTGPAFHLVPPFLQLADEQLKRETQRNLQFDLAKMGSAGNFAQTTITQSGALRDLDTVNQQSNDLDGLREKLSRQKEQRSKLVRDYFEMAPDGKLRYKQDVSQVQKAVATGALISADSSIKQTNTQIDAAEKAKRDAESAANEAKQATLTKQGKFSQLRADVAGSELTLAAAGKPAEEPTAKAAVDSAKFIAELDAVLSRHGQHLSDAEKAQIRLLESTKELNLAEADWRNKLALTNATIAERIRSQLLLTDAIGKGYAAQRTITIETQLVQAVGPEKYNDPAWMKAHQPQVSELRTNIGVEVDAEHNRQIAEAVDKLGDEIELEKSLASVQVQGAEAVRLVTLAYKLRELTMQGGTQAQIKAEIDLANAQKGKESSANVTKIDQDIAATQRLTLAQLGGAQAVRQAQLQNRIEQIKRDVPTAQQPAEIQAATRQSEAQHQQEVTTEALKTGIAYQNQLQSIDEQIGALERLKATQGDSLAIEISLRSLDVERTRVLSQQALVLGTARDGMSALFREMATSGRSAAQDIHDAMADAFDGVNNELAKMASGQKSSWASLFQSISSELTKMGLQRIEANIAAKFFPPAAAPGSPTVQGAKLPAPPAQAGIKGAIASIFGSQVPTSGKRDGNTPSTALFVTMGATASSVPEGPAPSASEKSTITELTAAPRSSQSETSAAGLAELGNAYRDSYPKSSGVISEASKVSGTLAQSSTGALSGGFSAASTGLGIIGAIRQAHQQQVAKQTFQHSHTAAGLALPRKVGETVQGTEENAGFTLTKLPSGLIQRTPIAETESVDSSVQYGTPGGDLSSLSDLSSTATLKNALDLPSGDTSGISGFGGTPKGSKIVSESLQTPPGPSITKQVLSGTGKGLTTLGNLAGGSGGGGGGESSGDSGGDYSVTYGGTGDAGGYGSSGGDANSSSQGGGASSSAGGSGGSGSRSSSGGGATNYASMALGIGGMVFGLLAQILGKPRNRHLSFASVTPFGDKSWDGFRAAGGPVTAGKTYMGGEVGTEVYVPTSKISLIGKDGPQLFSPKESGTIIPNHKLSSLKPFGGYRADGGTVSPNMAYVGGERGVEVLMQASSSMASAMVSSARPTSSGGGDQPNVFIDARGTDPVAVEQRVRQGMAATHASAVRTAFMATQERALRTPGR